MENKCGIISLKIYFLYTVVLGRTIRFADLRKILSKDGAEVFAPVTRRHFTYRVCHKILV